MSAAKRHRAYTASPDGAVTRKSKRKIACSSSLYAHINLLPIDVLSLILSYIPLRPRLLCVAAVCRRWRDGAYRSVRAIKWTPSGPGVAETLHQRFPFLRDLCVEEYKGRGEFKLPARIERVDFAGACSCGGEFRPLSPCKHMRKSTAEAVVRMSEKSCDSECECTDISMPPLTNSGLYLTVKPLAHLGVCLDDLFYTAVPLLSASVAPALTARCLCSARSSSPLRSFRSLLAAPRAQPGASPPLPRISPRSRRSIPRDGAWWRIFSSSI